MGTCRAHAGPLVVNLSELYLQELHRISTMLTLAVLRLHPDGPSSVHRACGTSDKVGGNDCFHAAEPLLVHSCCPLELGFGQVQQCSQAFSTVLSLRDYTCLSLLGAKLCQMPWLHLPKEDMGYCVHA